MATNSEPGVLVRELLGESAAQLRLTLAAGRDGLSSRITYPRIQKAALAVTGHVDAVRPGRVQVLGATEIRYLDSIPPRKRKAILHRLCANAPVACIVITSGLAAPAELVLEADQHATPVLTTDILSSTCIDLLQRFLDERLAPRTSVHGVLVDVYGLGVLLIGESGIGKSECALDLITRGHRFVADDLVEIRRESTRVLVGTGPEQAKHHMEIRGLGIVNIRDLFGISSIRSTKLIELVILLEPWQQGKEYDRLGLDEARYAMLDVELPLLRMPVATGRNLAMLIEVAARNQLLKLRGHDAARRFADDIARQLEPEAQDLGQPPHE